MTMHQTTRNIVKATAMGNSLDVTFGPSSDDFHYQQHHGTISHQESVHSDKRIGVKLIFQGGGCEVQWNHGDNAGNDYNLNFVNLDEDGTLTFPWWSTDENDDQKSPFWLEIKGNVVRVHACENGAAPADDPDKWLVFDSSTYIPKEDN